MSNPGRLEFFKKLEPYLSPSELMQLEIIYQLAKHGHKNQWRDGNKVRYFEHPKAVALIIIDELKIYDYETLAIALLHDIIEDTFILEINHIELLFGKQIAVGVKFLTKTEETKEHYLERLLKYGNDKQVIVKLSDRLHNIRQLENCNKEKQTRYIKETSDEYSPLIKAYIKKADSKYLPALNYLNQEISKICKNHKT